MRIYALKVCWPVKSREEALGGFLGPGLCVYQGRSIYR